MKDQIIVFRLLPQECQTCHRLIRNYANKSAVLAALHAHHTLMEMSRILNTPRNTVRNRFGDKNQIFTSMNEVLETRTNRS